LPSGATSASVTQMSNNNSNAGFNIGDIYSNEYAGNLVEPNGTVGRANNSGECMDSSTAANPSIINSSPSYTGSQANCILLAYGTDVSSTTGNLSVTDTSGNYATDFDLESLLTPASYATGSTGFFGSDGSVQLNIVSGDCDTESPVGVSYNNGSSGQPNYYAANAGDDVSWDIATSGQQTSVPEPGSLLMFGTALAGLATASRRRRKPAGATALNAALISAPSLS